MTDWKFWRHLSTEPFMLITSTVFLLHQVPITQLLVAYNCRRTFNGTVCNKLTDFTDQENQLQRESALWMAAINGMSVSIGLVMSIVLGVLADKMNKTRLMILTPIFSSCQSIIYFLISRQRNNFHPAYLLIGAVMSGLYGEIQGAIMVGSAYLAEITDASSRTLRFTLLALTIYGGFLIGGLPSGYLVKTWGFPSVFLCTLCLNLVNFMYVRFWLWNRKIQRVEDKQDSTDRSPPVAKSSESSLLIPPSVEHKNVSCLNQVKEIPSALFHPGIRAAICIILLAFFLSLVNIIAETTVQVLYVTRSPLHFSAVAVGNLVTLQNVIRAVSATVLNLLLTITWQVPDIWILALAFLSHATYFLSIGLSKTPEAVYGVQILSFGLPLIPPTIRSMITKLVHPYHHGIALASAGALDCATGLVSTTTLNVIYASSVSFDPALAFYIFFGIGTVGLSLALIYRVFVQDKIQVQLDFPREEKSVQEEYAM